LTGSLAPKRARALRLRRVRSGTRRPNVRALTPPLDDTCATLRAVPLAALGSLNEHPSGGSEAMTLIWFLVWFIFNLFGDEESLPFAPVNW
jgi:hypothetical protein